MNDEEQQHQGCSIFYDDMEKIKVFFVTDNACNGVCI